MNKCDEVADKSGTKEIAFCWLVTFWFRSVRINNGPEKFTPVFVNAGSSGTLNVGNGAGVRTGVRSLLESSANHTNIDDLSHDLSLDHPKNAITALLTFLQHRCDQLCCGNH